MQMSAGVMLIAAGARMMYAEVSHCCANILIYAAKVLWTHVEVQNRMAAKSPRTTCIRGLRVINKITMKNVMPQG